MRFLPDSDDGLSPLDRGEACETFVLCLEKYLVNANKGNKGSACMCRMQCFIVLHVLTPLCIQNDQVKCKPKLK